MILELIASSTGDPATTRTFNLLQRDDSGYIYASGYDDTTWFYNGALEYITEDAWESRDFQLWPPTGYFVQTNFFTAGIGLASFNGSTVTRVLSEEVAGVARGCAINGTYAYFWNDASGFLVYNYSGTLVNTVASSIKPKLMYCFDNGTKLITLGEVDGKGAYLSIYSLSGANITLIDTYTIASSGNQYVTTDVGYPYISPQSSPLIYLSVNTTNPFKEFYFNGSTISLIGEYPFSPGVSLTVEGVYGDSIFVDRASNYIGEAPYGLVLMDKYTHVPQSIMSLSTDPGLSIYGDGNLLLSTTSTGSRIDLYKILPASNHEHFQAIWR